MCGQCICCCCPIACYLRPQPANSASICISHRYDMIAACRALMWAFSRGPGGGGSMYLGAAWCAHGSATIPHFAIPRAVAFLMRSCALGIAIVDAWTVGSECGAGTTDGPASSGASDCASHPSSPGSGTACCTGGSAACRSGRGGTGSTRGCSCGAGNCSTCSSRSCDKGSARGGRAPTGRATARDDHAYAGDAEHAVDDL